MQITRWVCARKAFQLLGACFAVLLFSLSAFSQANSGRILGSITDQTGGSIAGATVTVKDVERGTTRTLTTDEAGAYNAPSLIPGTYTVKVEFQGFKTVERQNVVLEVGKEVRVDLSLQPGEQAQVITVTEAIPLVETTNATLGGTLQPGTIADLPLNGRNFMNLLQLRPGITVYPGGGAWTQTTNGLRPEHNVYILDGITAMEPLGSQSTINSVSLAGDAATLLPIDTIQEFNTQQNPKAEYGWKPGSITNVALKSGTNTIHGSANAFGRTDALDAKNAFLASGQKQSMDLKEFGATLGGPIKKDKVFFFMGYEGQRYTVGNPAGFAFPSMDSTAAPLANGQTASIVTACNNVALANRSATSLKVAGLNSDCSINSAGYSIFNLDPASFQRGAGTGSSQVSANLNTNFKVDNGLAKVDLHLGNKNTINGKYFIGKDTGLVVNNQTITQPYWRPAVAATSVFLGAQWNYIPNSTVVNTFRFGFNYFYQTFETSDCGGANGAPNYGLAFGFGGASNNVKPNCGFTNITLTGFDGAIGCCSSFPKYYGPDHIFEFIENVSILHGNHTFKLGGEVRASTLGNTGTFNRGRGQVTFDTLETFIAGSTSGAGQIFLGDPRRHLSGQAYAAFFQDDWRVSKNFMLNLGLRYEYVTPIKELNNKLANFDPAVGLVQLGNQTNQMWNPDKNNFAPRLGFAWDIQGNGKTVLRGGANMIYVTAGWWNQVFQQNQNDPTTGLNGNPSGFQLCTGPITNASAADDNCSAGPGNIVSSGIALAASSGNSGTPVTGQVNWNNLSAGGSALYGGNIYPGVSDAATIFRCGPDKPCPVQATNQNLKNAYVTSWSLGIQKAFTNNLSLQLDYVGNHATKLIGLEYTNTPPAGTGWTGATGATFGTGSGNLNTCLNSFSGTKTSVSCSSLSANALQPFRPFNSKFPYISYIYTVSNPYMSNYNGMQATLTQRATHGLSYTLGFTWAHALDEASSERGGPFSQDPGNFRADYANSDFDIRKRFTATITYALPGKEGYFQTMSGWKLTSIVTLQSALPWGIIGNRSADLTGMREGANDRWDIVGNPDDFSGLKANSAPFFPGNYKDGPTTATCGVNPCTGFIYANTAANQAAHPVKNGTTAPTPLPASCLTDAAALNPSASNQTGTAALYKFGCFTSNGSVILPPGFGQFGTANRNIFRGNGMKIWDFSVIKDWRFTERFRGEFRWEIFNVLNKVQYGNPQFNGPGGNDPSGNPGHFASSQSTPDVSNNNPSLGSGGPREMQLGFRLNF